MKPTCGHRSTCHTGEVGVAKEADRLKGLEPDDLRLHKLDRDYIEIDQVVVALVVGRLNCHFLAGKTLDGFIRRSHGGGEPMNPNHRFLCIYSGAGFNERIKINGCDEETVRLSS